jgi:hypothetical protein
VSRRPHQRHRMFVGIVERAARVLSRVVSEVAECDHVGPGLRCASTIGKVRQRSVVDEYALSSGGYDRPPQRAQMAIPGCEGVGGLEVRAVTKCQRGSWSKA